MTVAALVSAHAAVTRSMLALKPFQQKAVDTICAVIQDTAGKIAADPSFRRGIALAQGTVLLRAPTGSGKTLTVARSLEAICATISARTVWFWFTPFSGLVTQTTDALKSQTCGLRLRDIKTDRVAAVTRDGDVFVATWALVATSRKESRKVRTEDDGMPSLDQMLRALRADGFGIGAVIDEAHINFGTSAKQAAAFYLDVLQPDFTILATATPKDAALEAFCTAAGIERINRIEIDRETVVRAHLNKVGIRAGCEWKNWMKEAPFC
jgi:type III restriction enzyme